MEERRENPLATKENGVAREGYTVFLHKAVLRVRL